MSATSHRFASACTVSRFSFFVLFGIVSESQGRARELGILKGNERFAAKHGADPDLLRAGVAGSTCKDISTFGLLEQI